MLVSSLGFSLSTLGKDFFAVGFHHRIRGNEVHDRHEVKAELRVRPMRSCRYRRVLFIETWDIKCDGKQGERMWLQLEEVSLDSIYYSFSKDRKHHHVFCLYLFSEKRKKQHTFCANSKNASS